MWRLIGYRPGAWRREKECTLCGRRSVVISEVIGVCVDCLRDSPRDALKVAMEAHYSARRELGLPEEPPREGVRCGLCSLDCRIPEGGLGYCGLVTVKEGRLVRLAGTPKRGVLEWYYDSLPTNCVAWWFCPGCTGLGYPKYAVRPEAERGFYNLAVFYGACNHNCLFCQNWHYKRLTSNLSPLVSAEELASKATRRVTCICYFGGDPGPQMPHAIATSIKALEAARREGRILRICWETNGHLSEPMLKQALELSLESGGVVKFDIKAWSPPVYKALTGVDRDPLPRNVELVMERFSERPEVPLFTASTLLVPGYVDEYEVREIARFLASFDRDIPYSLLAFHPDYLLTDLPPTSTRHAKAALKVAKEEGLRRVNVGNVWLLGDYY